MPKEFEIVSDNRVDVQSVSRNPSADFGGDLASSRGIDIHAVRPNEHASMFRSEVRDGVIGAAEWSVGKTPTSASSYFGGMAISQSDHIGKAAYHGVAGTMDAAIRQHGNVNGGANNYEISNAIREGANSAGRTEPIETVPYDEIPKEGMQIYDGETGIDLTDERLQGYESLDDVPPEILDDIRNNPTESNEETISDDTNSEIDELSTDSAEAESIEDIEQSGADTSIDDTHIDNVPIEDIFDDDLNSETDVDMPIEDISVDDAQFDDSFDEDLNSYADIGVPIEDMPVEDTLINDAPIEDMPIEDLSVDDMSIDLG